MEDKGTLEILIRLHETADLNWLKKSIQSIQNQNYPNYGITILGQSLSPEKLQSISNIWDSSIITIINFDLSEGDHRSFLLNQGLKKSTAEYVAILDYDDQVFNISYSLLIDDLKSQNAHIAFGGVQKTIFDDRKNQVITTTSQAYLGPGTYYQFLNRPHFPIHSYILNLKKIRLDQIELPLFNENLRYLEDSCFLAELLPKVKSSFSHIKQDLFEYIIRTNGQSHALGTNQLQRIDWNNAQDEFYKLGDQLKQKYPNFILYTNRNLGTHLKSYFIGFLNRHRFLRSFRDVLKKITT